ncbi:hypothetical protein D3C83_76600 [compost metagenome]
MFFATPSSVNVFATSRASSIVFACERTRNASRESSFRPSKVSTQLYGPDSEMQAFNRFSNAAARAE